MHCSGVQYKLKEDKCSVFTFCIMYGLQGCRRMDTFSPLSITVRTQGFYDKTNSVILWWQVSLCTVSISPKDSVLMWNEGLLRKKHLFQVFVLCSFAERCSLQEIGWLNEHEPNSELKVLFFQHFLVHFIHFSILLPRPQLPQFHKQQSVSKAAINSTSLEI